MASWLEAIDRGRSMQMDYDEFFNPIVDDPILANWLDHFDQLKNYRREEYLDERKWKKARMAALERDGGKCLFPDTHHSHRIQVHHLQPLRYGGDAYGRWNLASVCLTHHIPLHPGMGRAYEKFKAGNKNAFHEYAIFEGSLPRYEPPKEALILRGIVIEKERAGRIHL